MLDACLQRVRPKYIIERIARPGRLLPIALYYATNIAIVQLAFCTWREAY
jgi:hypothetical protein